MKFCYLWSQRKTVIDLIGARCCPRSLFSIEDNLCHPKQKDGDKEKLTRLVDSRFLLLFFLNICLQTFWCLCNYVLFQHVTVFQMFIVFIIINQNFCPKLSTHEQFYFIGLYVCKNTFLTKIISFQAFSRYCKCFLRYFLHLNIFMFRKSPWNSSIVGIKEQLRPITLTGWLQCWWQAAANCITQFFWQIHQYHSYCHQWYQESCIFLLALQFHRWEIITVIQMGSVVYSSTLFKNTF